MGEDELPPVVAPFLADISKLIRGIEAAKQWVKSLDDLTGTATADVDTDPGMSHLLGLEEALAAFNAEHGTATADVNVAPALAGIDAVNAALDALSARQAAVALGISPSSIYTALNRGELGGSKVGIPRPEWGRNWRWSVPASAVAALQNSGQSPAQLEALLTGGGAPLAEVLAGHGGGGGGGGIGPILAGAAAGGGGGGGKGPGLLMGMLGALGWGKGKGVFGLLPGMASFGSAAGLAGFGAEHLLTSGVGVAGSLVGGALGGGLLGLGALGVAGVGMGTDMAGLGQAASDIKAVVAAQNQLATAQYQYTAMVAAYGKTSRQAALALQQVVTAQANVNFVLSDFSPVARGAILQAANAVQQFKTIFDKFTGPAEKTGAQIITGAIGTAAGFIPTVGKYAATNMGIIKKSLNAPYNPKTGQGGLFGWLGSNATGGGLGIFTDLEKQFTGHLPTAMHALTQGFELFAKTVDTASHYTGGFLSKIDAFLTKMNTSDFGKWQKMIGDMIGLFRAWLSVGISAITTVIALFRPAVGFGKALALALAGVLQNFTKFLNLASTQKALHGLFSAHMKELIGGIGRIIGDLLPVVEGLALGFIHVATAMTSFAAAGLGGLAALVHLIVDHPIVTKLAAWAAEFLLVRNVLRQLDSAGTMLVRSLIPMIDRVSTAMLGLRVEGFSGMVAGWKEAGASATAAAAETDAAATSMVAAEGEVATGAEVTSGAMGGMIGPIGMAAAAITVMFLPAILKLFKHGPSAFQQITTAANAMNQKLAQMPTGSVLQMGNDLDTLARDMQKVTASMQGFQPGSSAMYTAAGQMQALYGKSLSLNAQMSTMDANVSVLTRTFGISQSTVQSYASEIGINLKQAMDPTQVQLFVQALQESGQTFNQSALKSANWAHTIAANMAAAVKQVELKNETMVRAMSTASNLIQIILGHGSVLSMAAFVQGQRGGLPYVEAVAHQYGIVIPTEYTNYLAQAMGKGGTVSMQRLGTALSQNLPAVAKALDGLSPLINNVNLQLVAQGAQAGAGIGNALVRGIGAALLAGAPQIASEGALAVAQTIGAMHKAAQTGSPSRLTMQLGSWMAEGLAIGLLGGIPQASAAGRQLVLGSVAPVGMGAGGYAGGVSHAVTNTTNASHVEVNVMVPPGAPAAEIGHEVAWQIARNSPPGR